MLACPIKPGEESSLIKSTSFDEIGLVFPGESRLGFTGFDRGIGDVSPDEGIGNFLPDEGGGDVSLETYKERSSAGEGRGSVLDNNERFFFGADLGGDFRDVNDFTI